MKRFRGLFVVIAAAIAQLASASVLTQTGGTVTDLGHAELYTWTATSGENTLTVPAGGATVDILLVGGGGAGGYCRGGGGGGGGVVYQASQALEAGTYTIVVGAGGVPDTFEKTGSCYQKSASSATTDGGASAIILGSTTNFVAYGGGGGGTFVINNVSASAGRPGASGGGSAGKSQVAATGIDGQGHAGGKANSSKDGPSGGGGGASTQGGDATVSVSTEIAGNGGAGVACLITDSSVVYGGGGGGGVYSGSNSTASGGGGAGSGTTASPGAGTDGLGGGGGGASGSGNKFDYCGGGAGGSGVVIVRLSTIDPETPVLSATSSGAPARKFSVQLQVVSVGTNETDTVNLYVAKTVDSVAGEYSLVTEGLVQGASCNFTEAVSYLHTYTYRFKIVNPTTAKESSVQELSFTPVRDLAVMPGVYGWNLGAGDAGGTDYNKGKSRLPFALFDGNTNTFCSLNSQTVTITYDFGALRNLAALRFYPWDSDGSSHYACQRSKDMKIYGSTDGESWTLVYDQGGVLPTWAEWNVTNFTSDLHYRQLKITDLKYGQMAEVEFLSDGLLLKSERPCPWGTDTALGAADAASGVRVTGSLVFAPSGSAQVFGYCAETDYGTNVAAWAANGRRFEVGTVEEGDAFAANISCGGGEGIRYLRLFAQDSGTIAASQRTESYTIRTTAYCPKAYTDYTSAVNWYDANLSSHGSSSSKPLIFDLTALPAEKRVVSVRFWPRVNDATGYALILQWSRLLTAELSVSDTAATFTGTALSAGTNDVTSVSALPSQTWIHLCYLNEKVQELPPLVQEVVIPSEYGASKYLKVSGITDNDIWDLELRVCDPTAKHTAGLAIYLR